MTYFTVKQIAEDLNVSDETVRRWLRSNQLAAEDLGPKLGWRVEQDVYEAFKAKYRGTTGRLEPQATSTTSASGPLSAATGTMAGSMAGSAFGTLILPGVGTILGGVIGAVLGGMLKDRREIERALETAEAEVRLRTAELETLRAHVRAKEAELSQLQAQIEMLQTTRRR